MKFTAKQLGISSACVNTLCETSSESKTLIKALVLLAFVVGLTAIVC